MEALLYFIIWAALILLVMRISCGAHVMGRNRANRGSQNEIGNPRSDWVPPNRDTDPVCGKTVATDNAKPSVHAGNVYYFCSRECREMFEAAPKLYLDANPNHQKLEHSHA